MYIKIPNLKNSALLSWIGLLGIVFYAISPLVFPDAPELRQPEMLPVYTLMLGLGQLLKGNSPPPPEDGPEKKVIENEKKPS